MSAAPPPRRVLLLVPAAVALLAGLDAALMLLGLPAPVELARLPEVHGMLLVLGFLGTLISLERAVALGRPLGYAAPALLGLGGLLLVSPAPIVVGKSLLVAGAGALVALYVPLWRRQRDDAVLAQVLGAVLALGGAVLWLGGVAVPLLLPWLIGFAVLTIAGERLELARIAFAGGGADAGAVLMTLCGAFTVAVAAALLLPAVGYPLLGAALLVLVGWLAAHDIARRTVRGTGLPRYMAACMLAGYAWLAVTGGTWLIGGAALEGAGYDVIIHSVFLGFTVSMVMAHAPVILPAVIRKPLPYHPVLWVPAGALHLSLVLRLYVGDALGSSLAWQVGGVVNIVAVLLFLASSVWCASFVRTARPVRRTDVLAEGGVG